MAENSHANKEGGARRLLPDWFRFRALSSTRQADEEHARRNPFLAKALEQEKREGQKIAFRARSVALAATALLLVYVNPRLEVLYYEALLLVFFLIGVAQQRVGRVGVSRVELVLLMADLLLLAFTLLVPNPFLDEPWPTAIQFRFNGFIYFFVFLGAATLAYSWRTVLSVGVWAAIVWGGGALAVVWFGRRVPQMSEAVAAALDQYPRVAAMLDPNSIDPGSRLQEMVVFLIVAATLGVGSMRASRLLARQADLASERANLSRYFPPSMVEELASRAEPMGPVRSQSVAVMFADIVGFTRIAEAEPPEAVITLLRDFHAILEEAVFANHGTLDKYLGDGVMATFGTPAPSLEDAANAIRAALAMQEGMDRLNAARAQAGAGPIALSVGIHFGPVILGDIGTHRRMEFATLGDTVNAAARLENATRMLGCRIAASAAVLDAIASAAERQAFESRLSLRKGVVLRGREEPVNVWTA